ncbi:MAG: type III-A CRISPR-associated RAMP protein Csm3 [Ignavibacteriaceae bacterium]
MSKLSHYIKCTSKIEVVTGMHIGGSKDELKIGGVDSPVIKNPVTNIAYIPGSSLKGRFRMALELKYNDVNSEGRGVGPSQDPRHESQVVKLFGSASSKTNEEPTRFIFRDAKLSDDSLDFAALEAKTEVTMDRKTMSAAKAGPRTQERIPAGAKFDFEVTVRVFEGDDEKKFIDRLKEAMNIVEMEYLGGSGTRGYGKVKFVDLKTEKIAI